MARPPGTHTKSLTAQQRHDVRLLFFTGGLTKRTISERLGVSLNQVRYALRNGDEPNFKTRGAKPKLTEEQTNRLLAFITASPQNRRLSYADLAERSVEITGVPVGLYCIRSTLRRHGFGANASPTPATLKKIQQRLKANTSAAAETGTEPTQEPRAEAEAEGQDRSANDVARSAGTDVEDDDDDDDDDMNTSIDDGKSLEHDKDSDNNDEQPTQAAGTSDQPDS